MEPLKITNIEEYKEIMEELKLSKYTIFMGKKKMDKRKVFSLSAYEDMEDIFDNNIEVSVLINNSDKTIKINI